MTGHLPAGPRAVELDPRTGTLRMGEVEQRLDEATGSEAVFGAYLSLLYGVRGAQRGEELALRSADLEALLQIVGEDPDYIENRLIELMGCTPHEASLLKRVLLRHRALAATAGAVTALSLGALLGTASASSDTPASPPPAAVVTTPEAPAEAPPLEAWLTTDDGAHVPVPQDAGEQEPAQEPVVQEPVAQQPAAQEPADVPSQERQVAPQEAAPAPVVPAQRPAAVVASPSAPSAVPSAAPTQAAPAAAPQAPGTADAPVAEGEVVLGEPPAPLDRPGSWIQPPQPGDDDVVLG